jgi:hypothetical protein
MALRLEKLPDRMPVKVTIALLPELYAALHAYAACYQRIYGQEEKVVELIPYMLKTFLESDKDFLRGFKAGKQVSFGSKSSEAEVRAAIKDS